MPEMVASADGVVLLGRERIKKDLSRKHVHDIAEWEDYFVTRNIPIVARIQSWQQGQTIWPNYITASNLNRKPAPNSSSVRKLVKSILDFNYLVERNIHTA